MYFTTVTTSLTYPTAEIYGWFSQFFDIPNSSKSNSPTHHINPGPPLRIPPSIPPLHQNHSYHTPYRNCTPNNQPPDSRPYQQSKPPPLEPPQPTPKLTQRNRTNQQRVHRERNIIPARGIWGAVVSGAVLGTD